MKTAIVTGASKGIGKAIALKLASLNYAIVVVGRSDKPLAAIKETIEEMGSPCLTLTVNARAPFFLCKAAVPFSKNSTNQLISILIYE